MTTLWKRANGPQYRMLKIVSGAVLNAAHAHPNRGVDKTFARSVAKRAVGTLSSQWPEVLAAATSSSGGVGKTYLIARSNGHSTSGRKGSARVSSRPQIALIIRDISRMIKPLQKSMCAERAAGLIEALRVIDRHVKGEVR